MRVVGQSEVGCSHFLLTKTGQLRTAVNRAQAPYNQMQTLHVVAALNSN
jgi:hypothetical protein